MSQGLEQRSCKRLLPESLHNSSQRTPPFVGRDYRVREVPPGPEKGILLAPWSKCMEILSEVSATLQGEPILGVSIVSIILSLKSFCTSF